MDTVVPHRRRVWLYGLTSLLLLYLVGPVLIVVPMSFSGSRFLEFPPTRWSFRWYARFFESVDWYSSMLVSLELAVVTVILSVPIGMAAAYAIRSGDHPVFRRLYSMLLLPTIIPNMIVALGVFYIYVRIDWVGTFYGLALAHLMLALPFVVITNLSGLRTCDMSQELVARSLGCGRLRAFLSVTVPQIKGSVLTGVLLAFITSLDEVVVALFVAAGRNVTVTKVMFDSLHDEIDPTIAAVSSMLIACSAIIAGLAVVMSRRRADQMHHGPAEVEAKP